MLPKTHLLFIIFLNTGSLAMNACLTITLWDLFFDVSYEFLTETEALVNIEEDTRDGGKNEGSSVLFGWLIEADGPVFHEISETMNVIFANLSLRLIQLVTFFLLLRLCQPTAFSWVPFLNITVQVTRGQKLGGCDD